MWPKKKLDRKSRGEPAKRKVGSEEEWCATRIWRLTKPQLKVDGASKDSEVT